MRASRAVFLLAVFFTLCMPLKGNCANISEREAQRGMTVLMFAAGRGHSQAVQTLLDNKADINMQDKDGRTALMWVSSQNHKDAVKLLEQYGAK